MKKAIALLLSALMLLSFLTATASAEGEKVLKLIQRESITSMDPQVSSNVGVTIVMCAALEGLVTNRFGELSPGMADTWDISEDGLTYTFHLRDAKWSDGKPVTADDFYQSFLRLATDPRCAEQLWYADPILNIAAVSKGEMDVSELGVKAIDEKTLEIKLSSPISYFLQVLGHSMFLPSRADLVMEQGVDYGMDPAKYCFNGPFTITEWIPENIMVLKKNPDYWNAEAIKLDGVTFTVVNDDNTIKNMFDNGDIDYMSLGSAVAPLYKDYPGYFQYDSGGAEWIQFSVKGISEETGRILANRNFIMAVSNAIDRDALDKALFQFNKPYTGVINPSITAYGDVKWGEFFPEATSFHPSTANLDAAKEYLAKALEELGYKAVEELPEFSFIVINGDFYKTVGEYFQDTLLRNLNLKFAVEQMQVPQFYEVLTSGEYDFTLPGWSPDWDDPDTYLSMWSSSHPNNASGISLPQFDEDLAKVRTEQDPMKRAEIYKDAETVLLTQGPIIPVHMRTAAAVRSERVENIQPVMFSPFLDFRWAEIK